MYKNRDAVVRRAVARHIMQQVRHSRVAKHHRAPSTISASAFTAWPGCALEPETQSRPAAVSATTAAITALAAAMSSAKVDDVCTDVLYMPPVVDAEMLLIERIVELQREKEFLLRIVQRTSS
ncbi:hypothetical protein GGH94_004027 [Coemansia aciculifera]|uniref:Uncharacterized protein n=1 Tax=Coemansia aciculifera TaxID=417176 RepID=A0A9W8IG18_9FUNG|nr:hypothetical protein GGH94_004027 [Coemansia aciculifera]